MNKRLYVDLHVLQTVPPSCVNRDDTGSPKTAVYGGVRRARVSSQAWKHAMRTMFREELLKAEQMGGAHQKGPAHTRGRNQADRAGARRGKTGSKGSGARRPGPLKKELRRPGRPLLSQPFPGQSAGSPGCGRFFRQEGLPRGAG